MSRWSIFFSLAAIAAGYAGLAWHFTPPLQFTFDQYSRMKRGMTRAEVEAFFGAPPGFSEVLPSRPGRTMALWRTGDRLFAIEFDGDNKVRYWGHGQVPPTRSFWDRLQRIIKNPYGPQGFSWENHIVWNG